jgi:hypothetical protein
MSLDEKLTWLMGYHEGLMTALLSAANGAGKDKLDSQMRGLFPDTLTYPELGSAMDRFYKTPENTPVQLCYAVQAVQLKTLGVEADKIDQFLAGIRRDAAKMSNAEK